MTYSPHTDADRAAMLAAVGVNSVDDLFADIPASVRPARFDLPSALTEQEVRAEMTRLAGRNRIPEVSFLGAGAYRRLIPAVVDEVVARAEFATAYTPYQPEVSQGTLQSIYEFQSLICELTGMEVASASHYDGATATAEGALMACRLTGRERVAVSRAVHPQVRRVLETYCSGPGIEVVEVDADLAAGGTGLTDLDAVRRLVDGSVACLVVQEPNVFGSLEPMAALAEATHAAGAQFVTLVDPVSLAVLEAPGRYGADIVTAEGQPFGIPLAFGGPVPGDHGRPDERGAPAARSAGRGHPGRRRPPGLRPHPPGPRAAHPPREGGQQHLHQPGAVRARRNGIPGRRRARGPARGRRTVSRGRRVTWSPRSSRRVSPRGASQRPTSARSRSGSPTRARRHAALAQDGVLAGLVLATEYPELPDALLLATTELTTDEDIERLVEALGAAGAAA